MARKPNLEAISRRLGRDIVPRKSHSFEVPPLAADLLARHELSKRFKGHVDRLDEVRKALGKIGYQSPENFLALVADAAVRYGSLPQLYVPHSETIRVANEVGISARRLEDALGYRSNRGYRRGSIS